MDASSVLWTNWQEQLKELLTGIHGHQKKTLADLSCWASCYRAVPSCNAWLKPYTNAVSARRR